MFATPPPAQTTTTTTTATTTTRTKENRSTKPKNEKTTTAATSTSSLEAKELCRHATYVHARHIASVAMLQCLQTGPERVAASAAGQGTADSLVAQSIIENVDLALDALERCESIRLHLIKRGGNDNDGGVVGEGESEGDFDKTMCRVAILIASCAFSDKALSYSYLALDELALLHNMCAFGLQRIFLELRYPTSASGNPKQQQQQLKKSGGGSNNSKTTTTATTTTTTNSLQEPTSGDACSNHLIPALITKTRARLKRLLRLYNTLLTKDTSYQLTLRQVFCSEDYYYNLFKVLTLCECHWELLRQLFPTSRCRYIKETILDEPRDEYGSRIKDGDLVIQNIRSLGHLRERGYCMANTASDLVQRMTFVGAQSTSPSSRESLNLTDSAYVPLLKYVLQCQIVGHLLWHLAGSAWWRYKVNQDPSEQKIRQMALVGRQLKCHLNSPAAKLLIKDPAYVKQVLDKAKASASAVSSSTLSHPNNNNNNKAQPLLPPSIKLKQLRYFQYDIDYALHDWSTDVFLNVVLFAEMNEVDCKCVVEWAKFVVGLIDRDMEFAYATVRISPKDEIIAGDIVQQQQQQQQRQQEQQEQQHTDDEKRHLTRSDSNYEEFANWLFRNLG
jgi:hypothetical protein